MSNGPRSVQPDPLELATGMMLGTNDVPRLKRAGNQRPIREVLEGHVRRALLMQPCMVSFSGGRDSSSILALATHVARRDGLPDPVPVTLVFPDFPATHEEDWQRVVLDHLKLSEWIRLPFGQELDLVGPIAADVNRRLGMLFPSNTYVHEPILRVTSGGSLLTGIGGDEVLDSPGHPLFRTITGHRRARRSDLRSLPRLLAPVRVRRAVDSRRPKRHGITWLTAEAWSQVARRQAEQQLPERLSAALRSWPADRYYCALVDSFERLAAAHDVLFVSPFLQLDSLASFATEAGAAGFRSRQAALQQIVGDLLPAELLARTSKAVFDEAFSGRATESAINRWDGHGFPLELVDPVALRTAMTTGASATRWSLGLQWLLLNGNTSVE